jgi:hypothetical protein
MSFISFPLRLEGDSRQPRRGGLVRCERVEAINALMEIMANTPAGSWSSDTRFGCPFFMGLSAGHEGRTGQALAQQTVRTLDLSLQELGVTDFRLESIARRSAQKLGEVRYEITLRSTTSHEAHTVEIAHTSRNDGV